MLPLAILGIFLWVLLLLWRYNTAAVSMPIKEEAGPHSAGALGDFHPAKPPSPGGKILAKVSPSSSPRDDDETETETETSSTSGGPETEASDSDTQAQPSPEVNSDKPPLPPTAAEKPPRTCAPMLSSGPEARERLKFILGASEDNSSDEEHAATKPPGGASQPPTPSRKASAQTKSSPAGIK